MSNAEQNKSSHEIEREVEQTRARVSQTLEELRDRMSPGQVVDQLMDYARGSGGSEFVSNAGRAMRNNPLPVLLIGAGIAWLVASNAMPRRLGHHDERDYDRDERDYDRDERDYGYGEGAAGYGSSRVDLGYERHARYDSMETSPSGSRSRGMGSRVGGAVSSAGSAVSGAASSVGEAASSLATGMSHAVSRAASALTDAASSVGSTASSVGSRASRVGSGAYGAARGARRTFRDVAEEQPLVLGAIGLAIGAAIGAALPTTRTEDEYLGATADQLKRRAQELGEESYGRAKSAVRRAYDEARDEAQAQGLTPGSLGDAVRGLGDKLSAVADAAKEGARSEVEGKESGATPQA